MNRWWDSTEKGGSPFSPKACYNKIFKINRDSSYPEALISSCAYPVVSKGVVVLLPAMPAVRDKNCRSASQRHSTIKHACPKSVVCNHQTRPRQKGQRLSYRHRQPRHFHRHGRNCAASVRTFKMQRRYCCWRHQPEVQSQRYRRATRNRITPETYDIQGYWRSVSAVAKQSGRYMQSTARHG